MSSWVVCCCAGLAGSGLRAAHHPPTGETCQQQRQCVKIASPRCSSQCWQLGNAAVYASACPCASKLTECTVGRSEEVTEKVHQSRGTKDGVATENHCRGSDVDAFVALLCVAAAGVAPGHAPAPHPTPPVTRTARRTTQPHQHAASTPTAAGHAAHSVMTEHTSHCSSCSGCSL